MINEINLEPSLPPSPRSTSTSSGPASAPEPLGVQPPPPPSRNALYPYHSCHKSLLVSHPRSRVFTGRLPGEFWQALWPSDMTWNAPWFDVTRAMPSLSIHSLFRGSSGWGTRQDDRWVMRAERWRCLWGSILPVRFLVLHCPHTLNLWHCDVNIKMYIPPSVSYCWRLCQVLFLGYIQYRR